jgi:NADPH-dependent 2,4-dienoyl-CoA reductase/sulfur reductase-like enzyme
MTALRHYQEKRNTDMTVVIIGGDAAGMSAASRIARKDKNAHVIVFEKTDIVSYGACGLPYYISGVNDNIELVKMRSPEQFRAGGVDLRLRHEVTSIDTGRKTVSVRSLDTGKEFSQNYDKLLIATGSKAIVPPVEGKELKNVFVLKTIPDAEAIKSVLLTEEVRTVAIIGGGFIGMEVTEAVIKRGKKPLLFEALPHVMNGFDELFQTSLEKTLSDAGAQLHLGETVSRIDGKDGRAVGITTPKGIYDVDMVIFAIGVRPNTEMFPDSAFKKLRNGAIIVNESMETGVPDVYAAGDCATVYNAVKGEQDYIALGSNANKQGRVVGDVIMGKEARFDRAIGSSMLKVLNFEMGKTGLSEREANARGLDIGTATVTSISHSPYYTDPAPYNLTAKIVYDKKTKVLLGAQIMGEKEAALRINIFACAIDRKMTTEELGLLDIAYSPSLTFVWDIVHIVANAAK